MSNEPSNVAAPSVRSLTYEDLLDDSEASLWFDRLPPTEKARIALTVMIDICGFLADQTSNFGFVSFNKAIHAAFDEDSLCGVQFAARWEVLRKVYEVGEPQ